MTKLSLHHTKACLPFSTLKPILPPHLHLPKPTTLFVKACPYARFDRSGGRTAGGAAAPTARRARGRAPAPTLAQGPKRGLVHSFFLNRGKSPRGTAPAASAPAPAAAASLGTGGRRCRPRPRDPRQPACADPPIPPRGRNPDETNCPCSPQRGARGCRPGRGGSGAPRAEGDAGRGQAGDPGPGLAAAGCPGESGARSAGPPRKPGGTGQVGAGRSSP